MSERRDARSTVAADRTVSRRDTQKRSRTSPSATNPSQPKRRGFRQGRSARVTRTQMDVVRDVMLSAAACKTWLTLRELAALTGYGEASISAQLRHLRKRAHGAHLVGKRMRTADARRVWEYRVER